jgi:hypothetical protein
MATTPTPKPKRRYEDLTPEEKKERAKRFTWEPEDIVWIKPGKPSEIPLNTDDFDEDEFLAEIDEQDAEEERKKKKPGT